MKRLVAWSAVALSVLVVVLLVARSVRKNEKEAYQIPPPGNSGRIRPGAGYKPKAEPLRHAERPELPESKSIDTGTENTRKTTPAMVESQKGRESGAARVRPARKPSTDPGMAAFSAETDFSKLVWSALEASDEDLLRAGEQWLNSSNPEDRALGGVMLFFSKGLFGDNLDQVIGDEDPMVPLAVCDWVRDYGSESDIRLYKNALKSRGMSSDDLFEMAKKSANLPGGGRSALDLWLEEFPEEEKPTEDLATLVGTPSVSYDVREQALFKLLEPATKDIGVEALATFANGLDEKSGSLIPNTVDKLSDLADTVNPDGDDEKIWDSEACAVFFLSQTVGGLPARDLANYLEYALRRDDPEYAPVIEEGTWEFANDFLLARMPYSDTFPQAEVDALDRIAMSLDRLIDYDPAFNPFETVEDDGDEPDDVGNEGEGGDNASTNADDAESGDDDAGVDQDDEADDAAADDEDADDGPEDDDTDDDTDDDADTDDDDSGADEDDAGGETPPAA